MLTMDSLSGVVDALKATFLPTVEEQFKYAISLSSSHLLTSNRPPTPNEADRIRDFLNYYAYKKINFLSRRKRFEIDDVEELRIYTERQQLQTLVKKLEGILSPVRKLPRNVIQLIILNCDSDHFMDFRSGSSNTSFPLVFTQVCSLWRTTALATPTLWRNIWLKMPDAIRPSTERMVRLFLARSRAENVLLDVRIDSNLWHPELPGIDSWLNKPAVMALLNHAHRMEVLILPITCNALMSYPILESLRGNLPSLRFLAIGTPNPEPGFQPQTRLDLFMQVPKLQELVLYHCVPPTHLSFPSRSPVTNFRTVQPLLSSHIGRVLSLLPHLETFVGTIRPRDEGLPPLYQERTNLRSLVLHHKGDSVGQDHQVFLKNLVRSSFPNLEHVILPVTEDSWKDVVKLLRSKPTIQKLEIKVSQSVSPSAITKMLRATPNIRALLIREETSPFETSSVLNRVLNHLSREGVVLPLQHLSLESSSAETLNALFPYLEYWLLGMGQLREVTIYVPNDAEQSMVRFTDYVALRERYTVNIKIICRNPYGEMYV